MSNPRRTNKWSNSQPAPVPKPNDGAATLTRTAPSLRILLLTGLKWMMAMEWNILPHTRLPAAHQVESQFGGCAVKTTFGRHIVYTFLLLSYSHYTPPQPIIYFLSTNFGCFELLVGVLIVCVCGTNKQSSRNSRSHSFPNPIRFSLKPPESELWTRNDMLQSGLFTGCTVSLPIFLPFLIHLLLFLPNICRTAVG